MAKKEEGPLEYERRLLDTKGVAQRVLLGYLKRPAKMLVERKKTTWILVAVAAAACVPLVLGLGGKRALSTGPLSNAHAAFEGRCEVCHSAAFSKVPDNACEKCHDGAAHPANLVDTAKANMTVRCGECHGEHGGQAQLAMVANANCTRCHSNLQDHATGIRIKGVKVSSFRQEKHPEFSTAAVVDSRPFLLNHKKHMEADPKKFPRFMTAYMKCVDCHRTDLASRNGDFSPMTFEASCKSCHKRELQFDRYQVLGQSAMESPHTRDQNTIRQFIEKSYRDALAANPSLASQPLGFDNAPQPSAEAWVAKVTNDSYEFLFGQKCTYCHKMESKYEVMKVDPRPPQSPTAPVQAPLGIKGRYPDGKDWFERSEFSHRAHREVECESCHTAAKGSSKTEDVLIPVMKACLPCHGESRASLDRCSECHLYHNRSLEKERDRRPTEKIIARIPPDRFPFSQGDRQ